MTQPPEDVDLATSLASKRGSIWPSAVVVVGMLAWLWPIGLGRLMPIGGDVTQFSIGLMDVLSRSIRSLRLPFWNPLWGYGFPGLAESQMGVYYPPNLVLYGLFPVELAYTLSLVGHTLWAGLGAAWAARRFGASRWSGALAGLAWASSGFFLIHLPHHWAATTASWMPWAWGLAWSAGRGDPDRPRAAAGLAAVLTIQLLPGHFQLGFITEVTAALIGLLGCLSRSTTPRWRRVRALALAFVAVVPLGLAQLGPTFELAALAKSDRTEAYLSAFPSTPLHLVSYVAPGLFQRSPLWRPLAWDAFHAMPEEHRASIGLVPLFLAGLALLRGGWRDPNRLALAFTAVAATCLSLGPYFPGFSTLCRIPGFSFFRAPARWGSAAMLALSLLAARGLDVVPTLRHPGRWLVGFVVLASLSVAAVLGLFELALTTHDPASSQPVWPELTKRLDLEFRAMPWPDEPTLGDRIDATRRPLDDPRVPVALARQGLPYSDPTDRTLARRRFAIYAQEVGPTVAWLVALGLVGVAARWPWGRRGLVIGLGVVFVAEAGYESRQRSFDLGPIRPLTEQSPVLGRLGAMPRGVRSLDPARNLSMVAGVAAVSAYRTLDLPIVSRLTRLAETLPPTPESVAALRAIGVGVRVVAPGEGRSLEGRPDPMPGWSLDQTLNDPTLMGWMLGADWVRSLKSPGLEPFGVWRPDSEPARAWFVSREGIDRLAAIGDEPAAILDAIGPASPVAMTSSKPEDLTIDLTTDGPGTVVIPQLDYPRWRALIGGEPVPIRRVLGGWQGVSIPIAGEWKVKLRYDDRPDRLCLAGSGVAWLIWCLVYWRSGLRRSDSDEETGG